MRWEQEDINILRVYRRDGLTISDIAQKMGRSYDSIKHAIARYNIDSPLVKKPNKVADELQEIANAISEETMEDTIERIKSIYSTKWQPTKERKTSNKKKNFKAYLIIADTHVPHQNDIAVKAVLNMMEDYTFDGFVILGDYMDMTPISHWLHEKNQRKSLEGMRMKEDYTVGNMLLDEFDKRLPKKCDKRFVYGNHERFIYDFIEKYPMLDGLFDPINELHLKDRKYTVSDGINPMIRIGRLTLTHGMYHNKHFLTKHIDEFKTNVLVGHLHTSRLRLENSPAKEVAIFGASVGCLCDLNPVYNRNKPNKTSHGFAVVYFYDNGYFDVDLKRIVKGKFVFNNKLYDGNK